MRGVRVGAFSGSFSGPPMSLFLDLIRTPGLETSRRAGTLESVSIMLSGLAGDGSSGLHDMPVKGTARREEGFLLMISSNEMLPSL